MGKLFGTDGIRGVANVYPLTAEMFVNIGRALVHLYQRPGHVPRIVIGKDTRLSGDMLEGALVAGVCSAGADALTTGVLPTPGVAFLSCNLQADAGVVISASHNPYEDNGIKIFDRSGFKLSDEQELAVERLILGEESLPQPATPGPCGRTFRQGDAEARYMDFLKQTLRPALELRGLRIAIDCSHGATFQVAPEIFRELGADTTVLSHEPNGVNINLNCGSQHPETLARTVLATRAAAGFAFDGDGDRLIAVDEKGQVLTGDQILAICAAALKKAGRLANNLVIRTVMSNCGMGVALRSLGIESILTDVGDRAVLRAMQSRGAVIGGEDSGHLIFLQHHHTGDGILSALQLLAVMESEGKSLSELAKIMTIFPQALINVKVASKVDTATVPEIARIIREVEGKLGAAGRVLVRYSGTQNICRVMVEGPTADLTERYCREIADVVQKKLG